MMSWLPKKYNEFVPFEYPDIKILSKYNSLRYPRTSSYSIFAVSVTDGPHRSTNSSF